MVIKGRSRWLLGFALPVLLLAASAPMAVGAAKPSQTVARPQEEKSGRPAVLVLPFVPADADKGAAWIGQAIGQTLTSDLSINSALSISLAKEGASDLAAAIDAAKDSDAQYVVFGTYQQVEGQIRITGNIADAVNGKNLAGLKATGALQDLFSLEDSLTHQVQVRLRRAGDALANGDDSKTPTDEKDRPATQDQNESAADNNGDVFADARAAAGPVLGVRRGVARDPNDWDNPDLDRMAFSDAGRGARIRYFYQDPFYAFPTYFGGYGYSPFSYGFGYGYGYGYGYRPISISVNPNRIYGWPDGDATAGYGNTPGWTRMTVRAPGNYGGSRGLDGGSPVRQPTESVRGVQSGGSVHLKASPARSSSGGSPRVSTGSSGGGGGGGPRISVKAAPQRR